MKMSVRVRGVREDPTHNDGTRVLVDRVWPRGVRKEDVHHEHWNRNVAPSTELRQWYGHDPDKFEEFARRYRAELASPSGRAALQELRDCVRGTRLTLLTATKDIEHSQARVLADLLNGS